MKFKKWEWEIILHRLEVDCAIWESLFQYDPKQRGITRDQVSDFCLKMMKTNGKVDFNLNEWEMEVLIDCMEGSTYLVNYDDMKTYPEDYGLTKSQVYSVLKSAKDLEERFDVQIPRY